MDHQRLQRILSFTLWVALVLLVISAFLRAQSAPSGGHLQRQFDTMGISTSFANELENHDWKQAAAFFLYPKVIQRGLLNGINVAEFPLFNGVGGFFVFLFGSHNGTALTLLFLFVISFFTGFFALPKIAKAWDVELSPWVAVVIWFSCGTAASQSIMLMPEGLAFALAVAGCALLTHDMVWIGAVGAIVLSLGISVKPTVLPVILGLALPTLWGKLSNKTILKRATLVGISLLFPAWWYTLHSKAILAGSHGPQIFAQAAFHPLERLIEMGGRDTFRLIIREPMQGQFPMYLGWIVIFTALFLRKWRPIFGYFLAMFIVIALAGPTILVHGYYLISLCLFSSLILASSFAESLHFPRLRLLITLILLWGVGYSARNNFWNNAMATEDLRQAKWNLGEKLSQQIPNDFHLATDDTVYPEKLVHIGRPGTMAGSTLTSICHKPEFKQMSLAMVSESNTATSLKTACSERLISTESIQFGGLTWNLTLVRPSGP